MAAKNSEGVECQLLLREVARHHGLLEPEMVDGEQPELPRIHGVQIQPDGPVQVLHLARHALSQYHLRDKVTMSKGGPVQVLYLARHALSQHRLLSQHHLRDKLQ